MNPFKRLITTPGVPGLKDLVTDEPRPDILSGYPGNLVPNYAGNAEMAMNGLGAVSLANAAWNILGRLQEAKTDEERKALMADAQTILEWIEKEGIIERQASGFATLASTVPRAANHPLSARWHLNRDRKPPVSVAAGVSRGETSHFSQKDPRANHAAVSSWVKNQGDGWKVEDAGFDDNDWLGASQGPANDHVGAVSCSILMPGYRHVNPSAIKHRDNPRQSAFGAGQLAQTFGQVDAMPDQVQSPGFEASGYQGFGN